MIGLVPLLAGRGTTALCVRVAVQLVRSLKPIYAVQQSI
ncbi:hypothetical protein HNO88_002255 [Novosphingobium chloroacetimidivorans]|uniref:Uncharacterized protein n=1 Tax=Novosphingobium chloroacetimidivorans TaxID=1428314 RepID=A0A7W7K9X5_9SPHN|nr:hypothetical protein [Novosphingobium chloroacetimidivorans]